MHNSFFNVNFKKHWFLLSHSQISMNSTTVILTRLLQTRDVTFKFKVNISVAEILDNVLKSVTSILI